VVVADTDPLVRREGVPSKTGVGPQAWPLSCLTAAISETICMPRELNDTWVLRLLDGVAGVALDAPGVGGVLRSPQRGRFLDGILGCSINGVFRFIRRRGILSRQGPVRSTLVGPKRSDASICCRRVPFGRREPRRQLLLLARSRVWSSPCIVRGRSNDIPLTNGCLRGGRPGNPLVARLEPLPCRSFKP
jgi:hypothetical protein